LEFRSSILNDPASYYYDSVYLTASIKGGVSKTSNIYWIDDNKPVMTGVEFLDEIKQQFNAEWRVRDGILYFERKDIINGTGVFIDVQQLGARLISGVSYKWINTGSPAAATFTYMHDGVDDTGSEVLREKFTLNISMREPYSPFKNEYKKFVIPYGVPRFNGDLAEQTIFEMYVSSALFGKVIKETTKAVIFSKETIGLPKVLLWDSKTPRSYAFVKENNKAFRFLPDEENNIYADFFYIEDSREVPAKRYEYEFTFKYNCEEYERLNSANSVILETGTGSIESIAVNRKAQTMTVKGKV
jgi:hypothetical protein